MQIRQKKFSQKQIHERVGNLAQIGGTRHYELTEGNSKGVRAIDFDTGTGFRFTVLPDRGMDISLASFKGMNLAFLTPNGEVNPAFYDPAGIEWLRIFFGGLLTTCGPTYFGNPCNDEGTELGIHGRATVSPARKVNDLSGWQGDEYVMEASGVLEDVSIFGDMIQIKRTIRSAVGSNGLTIVDEATNVGYRTSPFTILYHINPGFPLLDDGSRLVLSADKITPYDDHSAADPEPKRFSAPVPNCREENFLHTMKPGSGGRGLAAFVNDQLSDGLALTLDFGIDSLPFLSEWKMMGQRDYVVGIEPCNVKVASRADLRKEGILPFLEPGESKRMEVRIGVLEGAESIGAFEQEIARKLK